jgi:hypothetical protein
VNLKTWNPHAPAPGIYAMPAAQYHGDPCPKPSLSSGCLATLLDQSPYHAWYGHPRLGTGSHAEGRKTEIGSAVHRLVLDAGAELAVIEFDSYRSKAAQAAQDAANATGKLPILAEDYAVAQAIAGPLREATENYMGAKVADCLRECVIIWRDGPHWRRALIDIMTRDLRRLADIKTSRGSASPPACVSRIFDAGYELQAEHYTRAAASLDPEGRGRREFAFLFAEVDAPHCVSPPIILSEGAQTVARERWEVGSKLWDSCLQHDYWPAYDQDAQIAEAPQWFVQRWLARMNGDQTLNPVQPMEAQTP